LGRVSGSNVGQTSRECAYCAAVPIDSKIRVFRSPIHGYGVVALRDFEPQELIADVEGVLYREDEIKDDKYCLWVDENFYLDMVDQTRWINHCCDPNSEIEAELDGQGGAWARVVALRPIRAGEEITYDYGFPHELAEPCSCGIDTCKGWIVDSDELPELVERLARDSGLEVRLRASG
jgi:SET domain-containing protein